MLDMFNYKVVLRYSSNPCREPYETTTLYHDLRSARNFARVARSLGAVSATVTAEPVGWYE